MPKPFFLLLGLALIGGVSLRAEVLIVADEFPAMEVVAMRLKVEGNTSSKLLDQQHLPSNLARFQAVVVYIHKGLETAAERAFIRYAEEGGRLVLLHHSISSGKRQNRDWFNFLGVELPTGDLSAGGYKWIEGVNVTYFNLSDTSPVMTQQVPYPETVAVTVDNNTRTLPGFTLKDTEVYLNHALKGPHTLLLGLKYTDAKSGQTWTQETAGWRRAAKKGWVFYFMPGHSTHDFEDPTYGRMVVNALSLPVP
jgi:hypothetical protein